MFQVIVTHRSRGADAVEGVVREAKLSMIDLAGSERASVSKVIDVFVPSCYGLFCCSMLVAPCCSCVVSNVLVLFLPFVMAPVTPGRIKDP